MTAPAQADVAAIAETFRLLGDPTRLRILLACLEARRSVGEIAAATGASQSLVSHHLRLLRGARLVQRERDARQVFYQAADAHVRHMIADILAHSAGDGCPPQAERAAMPDSNETETLAFSAPEMSCGHCVAAISRAFAERLPGAALEIDLPGRTVRVAAPEEVALAILSEAGYAAVRI